MNGTLILIVGPSGVGKGTVIGYLKKDYPDFFYPVSCTTRDKRPGEIPGEVYNYISKAEFAEGIKAGKFLEYAIVHGENYYGTLKEPIVDALIAGKTVVREIDIQGFQSVQKYIPRQNLLSIFLSVPSWELLKNRIMKRHVETESELAHRRTSYEREMALKHLCDFAVESYEGDVERCVREVEEIIKSKVKS